jgi:hypothetical protein
MDFSCISALKSTRVDNEWDKGDGEGPADFSQKFGSHN